MLLDVLLFVSRWSRGSLSIPSACCGLLWPKFVSHYVMRESRGIILGMPVESKSNYCLETMPLRKSRLCSPLSSSRLVMMILMQSLTKAVHEKSICIQKLLSLLSLTLSSSSSPSSESSLSSMSSLLHPSRPCFTHPVDSRFYFLLNPICPTSSQSLVRIVYLSFFVLLGHVSVAQTGRRSKE